MATELHPVPEFSTFAAHVPDIIRPKPRRLSDVRQSHGPMAFIVVGGDRCVVPASQIRAPGDGAAPGSTSTASSSQFPELNCADLENDVFREDTATDDMVECTPLKSQRPLQRNLAGGSAPALHRPRPRSTSRPRPHTPHAGASTGSATPSSCSSSTRYSPSNGRHRRTPVSGSRNNNTACGSLVANREKFAGLEVISGSKNGSVGMYTARAGVAGDGADFVTGGNQETSPSEDYDVYDIDVTKMLVSVERR